MLGEVDEPGLMGRTLMDLFNCGVKAKFTVSFIEVGGRARQIGGPLLVFFIMRTNA